MPPHGTLEALHDSLVDQAKRLDFKGVFLEEQDLTEIGSE